MKCHALLDPPDTNWTNVAQHFLSHDTDSLSLGKPVDGAFDRAACHFYTFEVPDLASYHFSTTRPATAQSADTQLFLLDSDYRLIAGDDDGGFLFLSSIERRLDKGSYFLLVSAFNSRKVGSYRLLAEQPPLLELPRAPALLSPGTPLKSELAEKADLWLVFEVDREARWSLGTYQVETSHSETDTGLELYREEEQKLALLEKNDDWDPDTLYSTIVRPLTRGRYHVRVSNVGRGRAAFGLHLELLPVDPVM